MSRFARIVIPGVPHHVTQRGNRRQQTFFCDSDYKNYLDFMAKSCKEHEVEIWAYCLMPNHIHLIAVPKFEESLHKAIGEGHKNYTRMINQRLRCNGFLWQGRFSSCPMDESHLFYAARYIELNPVRAGLCERVEDYKWSSAQAHLGMREDTFVSKDPLLIAYPEWKTYLNEGMQCEKINCIRKHSKTGRPLGSNSFIEKIEKLTGRDFKLGKKGPKQKE